MYREIHICRHKFLIWCYNIFIDFIFVQATTSSKVVNSEAVEETQVADSRGINPTRERESGRQLDIMRLKYQSNSLTHKHSVNRRKSIPVPITIIH